MYLIAETRDGDNEEAVELSQPKIKLAMWVCIQYNSFTIIIVNLIFLLKF